MAQAGLFHHVAVIGLGLLGGSIAKGIKRSGIAETISATVRDPQRRRKALELGLMDRGFEDPKQAAADADLVIICAPVRTIIPVLESVFPALKPGCLVTDVGSTKYEIVKHAEKLCPGGISFIGGHPMAGSERSGFEFSDPGLFENALCVLTPTKCSDVNDFDRLTKFWQALKARVITVPADEHDLLVGAVSHLPHVVAVSLVNYAASLSLRHEKILQLIAGGFRDTTRIASSDPAIWRDICAANRMTLVEILRVYRKGLDETIDLLSKGDDEKVFEMFERAKDFRDHFRERCRGALEPCFEVIIPVEDRPGVIGEIAGLLGWEAINIKNIEILTVREGEFGNLKILLESREAVEKAVEVLRKRGFNAAERE